MPTTLFMTCTPRLEPEKLNNSMFDPELSRSSLALGIVRFVKDGTNKIFCVFAHSNLFLCNAQPTKSSAQPSNNRLILTNRPTSHNEDSGQSIKNSPASNADMTPFTLIKPQPLPG